MNFAESEAYLYSLGNEVEAMKLGLDNVRKLLGALGNPETKYFKVQVAGTNGKGSVCAFLNSICLEAGVKTGLYTSPHLVSVTERVKIDGVDISEDKFARNATHVRAVSEKLVADGVLENVPTFFEQVTAIALVAFAEANVDLAILETGMGGRFDAVTAANAEICAITRIDLDHQQFLGERIEEIAAEKAAIIREGSKVAIGEQQAAAMTVVLDRCREVSVIPRLTTEIIAREADPKEYYPKIGFGVVGSHQPETFTSITFVQPDGGRLRTGLGLNGEHQVENVRIALLLVEILRSRFPFTDMHVGRGLTRARHPGRLEWIGKFLLDGAHNVGGAKALAAYIDEFVTRPITMIFGAMRDKNVAEVAEVLWPRAETVILTSPQNPRALSADELFELMPAGPDRSKFIRTNSVKEALDVARTNSDSDNTILITGSLYLVGEAKRLLTRGTK